MAAATVALSAVATSFSASRRKARLSSLPSRRPSLFFLYAPEPSRASKIPPLGTKAPPVRLGLESFRLCLLCCLWCLPRCRWIHKSF
ncbi:unnamed protein product [Musa acuminata subsp. malaccensis]|uniref:(wild Malaysian banana) hypothetical protein n=1 Tax=Musa acuminata subsp. malaccensis TaxID=214687 RepID=A0A8D6ZR13_MUSAM|nr:unnamed protein product [Musa acuminata subsp. malaccensis]